MSCDLWSIRLYTRVVKGRGAIPLESKSAKRSSGTYSVDSRLRNLTSLHFSISDRRHYHRNISRLKASRSSILAVGPPLLTIMKDYECARQWIHGIREQSFEGNFKECAEFQVTTLLNSIEKPKKAGASSLKVIAFSSSNAYIVEA